MIQIDIDMPEKCGLCPLFHAEHPMYCQGVKADRKKKIVAPYEQPRPEWCPIHDDDFEKQIHAMFDHIWDCEIEHPVFQDTVGDLMNAVIKCHADMRGGAV